MIAAGRGGGGGAHFVKTIIAFLNELCLDLNPKNNPFEEMSFADFL